MTQQTEIDVEARNMEESRTAIIKARVVGGDRPPPQADQRVDDADQKFTIEGAVEPPYVQATLMTMLEHSNSLRQNVDSYCTNIHAHGHHFEAVIDMQSDDANERIRYLMFEARQREAADPDVADPNVQAKLPTDDEVNAGRAELEEQMARELMQLKRFFENCSLDMSFEELRMQTCQDEEVMGNGYWEVLRDASGGIAQFNYVAGFTMRLMPLGLAPVTIEDKVRVDDITWGEIHREKFFRLYIQLLQDTASGGHLRTTYFKELGDPRIVSAETGRVFPDEEAWERHTEERPDDRQATEVLHWRIHSSRSGYGIPRWIGNLLAVLGSRQVDEVNFLYFENKAVPPLVFLVSGGRVTEETINRLETTIEEKIKGKHNFHKILFIEAEGGSSPMGENSGRAKIEMKPLTQAINSDALYQKYDERNLDKVGMSFRLPRMLRGDIRDFNRATADAALEFAEKQVFAPRRAAFDWVMNRKILPMLGIRFWKFVSNAPKLTDPIEQGKLIIDMVKEGVLIPAEGRQEAEKVLNRELRNINADWTRQPINLTAAGIKPPPDPAADGEDKDNEAQDIVLTGTDLASIVTVNEMRQRSGLGDLVLPDGGNDPDGALTITEFRAKRAAKGEALGVDEAEVESPQGEAAKATVYKQAGHLIALRKAMADAESQEAFDAFEAAKNDDAS